LIRSNKRWWILDKKTKNNYRQVLGKWGEDLALKYLMKNGLELISRNYRTPDGEIDLVMFLHGQLIFVEVKTRKDSEYSLPEEAVTDEKIDHLAAAAEWFLHNNPMYEDNWRIDVISIIGTPGCIEPQIEWFENVS